jgi:hypothetical protein
VITLTQACDDRRLLNVKLHPVQRQLLEGLEQTPNGVWAAGRRGGKTLLASIVALHNILFRPDLDALVRPGETRFAVIVATNAEQGRVALRSARLIVENSPILRRWLHSSTSDELQFERDGTTTALRVFPCSSRGLRGFPVSCGVMDEGAHFVTVEEGDRAAGTIYRALRPSLAQFGHAAQMLIVSSPSGSTGWFAEFWERADRGELTGWATAQVSSAEMNPSIPTDFLRDAERDDPDLYPSEYLALFESIGSSFFDMSRFAPDPSLEVAQPTDAAHWHCGLDPALSSDAFGIAMLGVTSAGQLVCGPVEAVEPERRRGWTFEAKREAMDRVLARVGEMCRVYSAAATTDQHQSEAVVARLREHGVNARVLGMNRETKLLAFRELRDRLYDGSLVLPVHESLLSELARVTLRLEQAGPKIILPRSSRGHCDAVQALALSALELRFATAEEGEARAGRSALFEDPAYPGLDQLSGQQFDPAGGCLRPAAFAGLRDRML